MPLPEGSTDIATAVLSISVFGLVLTIWLGAVLVWIWRRRVREAQLAQRLGAVESGPSKSLHLWHDGGMVTTQVPRLRGNWNWFLQLNRQCAQVGWSGGAAALLVLMTSGAVVAGTATFILTGNALFAIGGGGAILFMFRAYFLRRLNSLHVKFDEQLVAALGLAARSLRAGHPLVGAFQMVAEEMASPIRDIFADICGQHEMGASIPEALQRAAVASHSDDMKLVAASVTIQARTGGNLAELMDRLAVVVKDRLRLVRRVRVLTAQTQFSKRVLLALPVIVFVLLNVIQPTYMTPLYDTPTGRMLLGIAVCGLLVGAWAMDRLAAVRF